jgi:uncharacterized membrane protein YhaH (DUF805 family)
MAPSRAQPMRETMSAYYQLFFSFEGRCGRTLFCILALAVTIVLLAAIEISHLASAHWHGAAELGSLRLIGLAAAWMLAVFVAAVAAVSSCAIAAKRLHDRGKSSAWLLLFYGVPVLIWLAPCDLLDDTPAFMVGIADVAILAWQVVELGCMRGTIGTNEYGPDALIADLHERRLANPGWSLR